MARRNKIIILISDAVYTGCGRYATNPDSKLLIHSIYDVLSQSSNDLQCFVTSSVDTMGQQKHGKCEVRKSGHGK